MTIRNEHGVTRRELLRAGSAAAALLIPGANLIAQKKRPLRVDAHAHVWTKEYLDLVEKYGKTDTWVRAMGAGPDDAEMDKRFAQMDAMKVDMQVLSICPQAPHFEDKQQAVTAARMANDLFASVVHRWPKKFAALVAVPLPHVDEALRELDRGMGQLGMIGAAVTTTIAGRSIADPAFAPFYEELNRRGTVLYIHPAGYGGYSPMIADYHITWMIGAPIEDTISVTHLITHGIPQKYPKMKIINSHLGGALPMLLQRMDNQYGWENPTTPEKPSISAPHVVRHGRPRTCAGHSSRSRYVGSRLDDSGTDFPTVTRELFKRAINYISEAGINRRMSRRFWITTPPPCSA